MFVAEQKSAREEAARHKQLYSRYQDVASPRELSEYWELQGDKARADFLASKKKTFEERMAKAQDAIPMSPGFRKDTPEKGVPMPPKIKLSVPPETPPGSPGVTPRESPHLMSSPPSSPPTRGSPFAEDMTHLDPESTHALNRLFDEAEDSEEASLLGSPGSREATDVSMASEDFEDDPGEFPGSTEFEQEEPEEEEEEEEPEEPEEEESVPNVREAFDKYRALAFNDGHDVDMEDPPPAEEKDEQKAAEAGGQPPGDGGWDDSDDGAPPDPRQPRPQGGPIQFVPMQAEVAHQEFYNAGPPALPIGVQGPISDLMKFIPKAVPVYDVGAQQMFHTSFLSKGSVRQKVAIAGGYLLLRPSQIIVVVPKVIRGTSTELGTYLQGRFPMGGNIDGKSYSNTSLLGEVIRRLPGRVTISY